MPDFSDDAPVVDVPCPICDDGGVRRRVSTTVWGAPTATVCRCTACDTVFLDTVMTSEEEAQFYEAQFAHYMRERGGPGETEPEEHFKMNSGEAQRRLKTLSSILQPSMSVLEVGSSTGFLLDAVAPQVASVTGVEPGRLYGDYANSRGIKTHADLSALADTEFDLILVYYVVEHLQKPVEHLDAFRRMLRPGGTIAIEVPNVDDALVRFYQLDSFDEFYWQKAHYFYYSRQTLTDVLTRAGYVDISLIPDQRYDLSNHLHWLMKGKPGGKGKYSDIFDAALDAEYARCLRSNWLCDTLFAIASNPRGA
jgi:2-polyprenyl-3-methyl-5-hydroxy-6-metoxy-1,4-benzoquinol methylase